MKVTGWTFWDDDKYKTVDDTYEEYEEAKHVVAEELRKNGYKFSGQSHQYKDGCCPIIDDKFIFAVSMRIWGGIMQRAYNLPDVNGFGYCSWAWSPPEEERYPEK